MRIVLNTPKLVIASLAVLTLIFAGCNQGGADTEVQHASHEVGHDHGEAGHDHGHEGHDLHGYWCVEHGVPEEICSQCNTKLAADFQQKGDWCDEHGRPDSQCFICHPELEEKFASQYEAKFGEKPPKPEAP